MLTHWLNCSRVLFFANRRRFAKIRSLRKLSHLQYVIFVLWCKIIEDCWLLYITVNIKYCIIL
ncbi:MAG: hypothetical protein PV344_05670, partial [Anaplasma sp.]|nr:hypothetical protein [Anaplasma sp.]